MAKKSPNNQPFKFAVNEATLMKTAMDPYLEAIAKAGFTGVELRRDETFEYLKTHSVQDLKNALIKNKLPKVGLKKTKFSVFSFVFGLLYVL